MIVDIHDLDAGEIVIALSTEPCDLGLDEGDARIVGEIDISGSITKDGGQICIDGTLSLMAELECSRCLTRFQRQFRIPLNVRLVPRLYPEVPPQQVLLERVDLDLGVQDSDRIELDEYFREAILLALPLKPLCQGSCRGLCPSCGEDLNRGTCGCSPEPVDPRWAKLDSLRGESETEE
jgi:uncharacterized protein